MPTGDSLVSKIFAWVIAVAGGVGAILQGIGAVGFKLNDGAPNPSATSSPVVDIAAVEWRATWHSGLAVGVFGAGTAMVVSFRRRKARRLATANRVVRVLHQRWFSANGYVPHAGHRVSLWVPWPSCRTPKEWRCLAVSSGETMPSWRHVTAEQLHQMESVGPVSATAYHGIGFSIPGLPEPMRNEPVQRTAFLDRSFLTEQQISERAHWAFASVATRVAARRAGLIEFIVMVERKDGMPFEVGLLAARLEDDPCDGELDLVAAIWTETMGEPQ